MTSSNDKELLRDDMVLLRGLFSTVDSPNEKRLPLSAGFIAFDSKAFRLALSDEDTLRSSDAVLLAL